jgi:beta-glucosidase
MAWLRTTYPTLPPVYITENGAAYPDVVGAHGADGRDGADGGGRAVQDDDRVGYLDGHLRALAQAISEGTDVRGYFCWSLMDNFEWAYGFSKRFGLVRVDYDTLERTPKASYDWYRALIAASRPG